ncbi:MAG TPA: NnrU family protein [Steroidobacteraceae bacterium]|nr:NnrU family protein [Steroidobacteraceae bacterium]
MGWLIAGLLLFLGSHSIGIAAPAWRNATMARLGPRAWKALIGLVSIAGFLMIIHGYGVGRVDAAVLYAPPPAFRHVAALLMLPVFPLLLATYLPGRIKSAVKHPMLTATKAWAVAHLLVNGSVADVLLFGGFLVWAVADRIAVGRRPVERTLPGAPPSRWNDVVAIVGGLVLYALFVGGLHQRWFGVAPLLPH